MYRGFKVRLRYGLPAGGNPVAQSGPVGTALRVTAGGNPVAQSGGDRARVAGNRACTKKRGSATARAQKRPLAQSGPVRTALRGVRPLCL